MKTKTNKEIVDKAVKEWSKQGRTDEQIWAVKNFVTGSLLQVLEDRDKENNGFTCNDCLPSKNIKEHKYINNIPIHERTDCPENTLFFLNESNLKSEGK